MIIGLVLFTSLQKRRSGRQVKRRKYNEDLDFKVVDDDGETIAVLGTERIPALSSSTLAWQAEVTACPYKCTQRACRYIQVWVQKYGLVQFYITTITI